MERERALEIVRKHYSPDGVDGTLRRALETLIPELTESEDERIRKVIYKILLGLRKEIFTTQDEVVTKDKVLAYLEKQKEQKPAEWGEEDENALKYLHELIDFGFTEKFCDAQTAADMRGWLNTRLKSLCPQPKQEWSEEDRRTIDRACVALRAYANGELPDILPSEILEYADKLQSLRPSWKPSEEQMDRLVSIVAALRKDSCDDMANFLAEIYHGLEKL